MSVRSQRTPQVCVESMLRAHTYSKPSARLLLSRLPHDRLYSVPVTVYWRAVLQANGYQKSNQAWTPPHPHLTIRSSMRRLNQYRDAETES